MVLIKKYKSYNKPPEAPEAFKQASAINFTDGKVAWISHVSPDKLAFLSYLNLAVPEPHANDASFLDAKFTEFLKGLQGVTEWGDAAAPWILGNGKVGRFQMALGDRAARVFIELKAVKTKESSIPEYRVRVEFNPRKLGPKGIEQLLIELEMAIPDGVSLAKLLEVARVKRVHAAVDILGINIAELTIGANSLGKRVDYHGNDGRLETVQLHRKKQEPKKPLKAIKKPLGPLAVRVYDKNRERAAHGKPPPFQGLELSRAEVEFRDFKKAVYLHDLCNLKPFEVVQIGYSGSEAPIVDLGGNLTDWGAYLMLRRASGPAAAASHMKLAPQATKAFEARIAKPKKPLVGQASHQSWVAGIEETGLGLLISKATEAQSLVT